MRLFVSALAVWTCGAAPILAEPSEAAACLAGLDLETQPVDAFAPGRCAMNALQSCRATHDDAFCMPKIAGDLLAHYDAVRPLMPQEPNATLVDRANPLGQVNLEALLYADYLAEADNAFDALRTNTACETMDLDTDEYRCQLLLGDSGITILYRAIKAGNVHVKQ